MPLLVSSTGSGKLAIASRTERSNTIGESGFRFATAIDAMGDGCVKNGPSLGSLARSRGRSSRKNRITRPREAAGTGGTNASPAFALGRTTENRSSAVSGAKTAKHKQARIVESSGTAVEV